MRVIIYVAAALAALAGGQKVCSAQTIEKATVTVGPASGQVIPADFAGFSYEVGLLADGSDYLSADNAVLLRLIKNLGGGILRVGGNSSDKTLWAGAPRTPEMNAQTLATTDIDRFAGFAKATGWKVIFGLNLGTPDPAGAADEAVYVDRKLGKSLMLFQIGNEPDLFFKHIRSADYGYADYEREWLASRDAVLARLPKARFAGPDVATDTTWVRSFADRQGKGAALITAHHYNTSGRYRPTITWETILSADTVLKYEPYWRMLDQASRANGLRYRIAECNSVSMGGKDGVSNVYASALWMLDFMWTVAAHNGTGVNFHGGRVSHYAPIALADGVPAPRPNYYAMLAFAAAGPGSALAPVSLSCAANCTAYAAVRGGATYVTFVNKDLRDVEVTVELSGKVKSASVQRLEGPAPEAKSGVTFAGSKVSPEGVFIPAAGEACPTVRNGFTVKVPALSAAVVTVK